MTMSIIFREPVPCLFFYQPVTAFYAGNSREIVYTCQKSLGQGLKQINYLILLIFDKVSPLDHPHTSETRKVASNMFVYVFVLYI